MNLFKLLGTIAIAGAATAKQDIDNVSDSAESSKNKFASGIKTVAKWGTAIVAGATTAATGLVKMAQSSAATADNIDKMSQKIGISRTAYQELDFICSQSGTSVDLLQMGIKSLTSAMDGAASGTKSNIEQFEKLGISVTDSNGKLRSQEDVMWETLSALQNLDNQTEKARLATELFGRSGTELMPLLNGASGSIEEMKKQAHDLGLVLSDELVDDGVELTDSLDQTKRAFSAIVTTIGASVMPIVTQASDYIQKSIPYLQTMVTQLEPVITSLLSGVLPPLMSLVAQVFPILMDLLNQILPPITQIVQTILPVLTNLLTMLLPPIVQIVSQILPILISILQPVLELLQPILDLLNPIINLVLMILDPLMELINMILPPLVEVISLISEEILGVLKPILEWFCEMLEITLEAAILAIMEVINNCRESFSMAWKGIKKVWNAAPAFFKGIWNGIKSAFAAVGKFFKDIFTTAWNGIKSVWSAVTGFFSGIWNGIKGAYASVGTWFSDIFGKAWTGIKNAFSPMVKFFSDTWQKIKNIFSKVGTAIADGIKGAVTAAINGILGTATKIINGFISAINACISVINAIPGVSINKLDKLNAPQLAEGGVLKKGQVGILEGNGAEAVVPLEKNTEWISKVADQMAAATGRTVDNESELSKVLYLILDVVRHIDENMYEYMVRALTEGTKLKIDGREFGRMVRTYA